MTAEIEAPSTPQKRRLYRSRSDRKLLGVIGGIAEYTGLDPSLLRIAYVIATVLTAFVPLMFLYVVMVFIVPGEPKAKPGK